MEFQTLETAGFIPAITGMRNPKKSWHKGDSSISYDESGKPVWILGEADKDLAQRLIRGGPVHSKYLRQIMVWVDITAPIYWWSEFDTYKVGVVRDSCSTMHTLESEMEELNRNPEVISWIAFRDETIPVPQVIVDLFQVSNDAEKEAVGDAFRSLIRVARSDLSNTAKTRTLKRILPSSFLQKATISLSYQNIRSMLEWRRTHRLTEWSIDFTEWAKTLPLAEELLFYNLRAGD